MSFHTTLQYYRPLMPPKVESDDLARFLVALRASRTLKDTGSQHLKVKFGESIAQDDKSTSWEEPTVPGVAVIHDIEWDISVESAAGLQDMIRRLAGDKRRVYRAEG